MAVTSKIPKKYRLFLFAVIITAFSSGVIFFVLDKWFMVEGEFGMQKHFLQYPLMKVHGATAFLMIMIFGFLLPSHIRYGWKIKPVRKSAFLLLMLHFLLIVSAYILYYTSFLAVRNFTSYFHLACGVLYPFTLIHHIIYRRSAKARL